MARPLPPPGRPKSNTVSGPASHSTEKAPSVPSSSPVIASRNNNIPLIQTRGGPPMGPPPSRLGPTPGSMGPPLPRITPIQVNTTGASPIRELPRRQSASSIPLTISTTSSSTSSTSGSTPTNNSNISPLPSPAKGSIQISPFRNSGKAIAPPGVGETPVRKPIRKVMGMQTLRRGKMVVFEGWLKKMSSAGVFGRKVWQKRYFKLEEFGHKSSLQFAKKPQETPRVLLISDIASVNLLPVMKGFRFDIQTRTGANFQLMGYSPSEVGRWVLELEAIKRRNVDPLSGFTNSIMSALLGDPSQLQAQSTSHGPDNWSLVNRLQVKGLEKYIPKIAEKKMTIRSLSELTEGNQEAFYQSIGVTTTAEKIQFKALIKECRLKIFGEDTAGDVKEEKTTTPTPTKPPGPPPGPPRSPIDTPIQNIIQPSALASELARRQEGKKTGTPGPPGRTRGPPSTPPPGTTTTVNTPSSTLPTSSSIIPPSPSTIIPPSPSTIPAPPPTTTTKIPPTPSRLFPTPTPTPTPTSTPTPTPTPTPTSSTVSSTVSEPTPSTSSEISSTEEIPDEEEEGEDDPAEAPLATEIKDEGLAILPEARRKIEDFYDVQNDVVLGSGLTSTVKLCISKKNKEEYAVKIITKQHACIDEEKFREEIRLLQKAKHKHIISLEEVFEDDVYLYLVTELAFGGELFDRILEKKNFSEKDAAEMIFKILDGVAYLHSRGIVHRDLKPENVLFSTNAHDAELKISDLGFAQDLLNNKQMLQAVTKLGTKGYAAPEVFTQARYDEKCDVWSLGVMTYIMLCGLPPFVELDENAAYTPFWIYVNQMTERPDRKLEFPRQFWKDISENAKHFCTCCLQVDPKKRSRSTDLLGHPWFKTQGTVKSLHSVEQRKQMTKTLNSGFDFNTAQEHYSRGDEDAFLRMLTNYARNTTSLVPKSSSQIEITSMARSVSTLF